MPAFANARPAIVGPSGLARFAAPASVIAFIAALGGCASAPKPTPLSCEQLAGLSVPASAIGLPTRGARVVSAAVVPASGAAPKTLGEHCKLAAEIDPIDPAAPKIKFQLALPVQWAQRALMLGGGGYDGTVPNVAGNVPAGPADMPNPLGRGYAAFGGDSGHEGANNQGGFGVNDEALRNFAFEALKKTRDAAVFLIGQRYGKAPARSYFAGGSTGGREALAFAQKWPLDFDGAIVLCPAYNAATLNGQPLRCAGGAEGGDACLSDAQIGAMKIIDTPAVFAYRLASGETQYPGFNTWGTDLGRPGSGLQATVNFLGLNSPAPAVPMPAPPATGAAGVPYPTAFWDQWVKFFVTRDPAFDSLSIDPEQAGPWATRISELTALQDVNQADLSAFERRGGKLLIAHGMADPLVSTRATEQCVARVRSVMGDARTAGLLRHHEISGYNHAVSAICYAARDSLGTLENWVENGLAPPPQVVFDTAGVPGRSRPLCEYPGWPKYVGSGDVNVAASFACATR